MHNINIKKFINKQLSFAFLVMLLIIICNKNAFASTDESTLIGVQTELPTIENVLGNPISPFGTSQPTKNNVYELRRAHKIEGAAKEVYLYTDKCFHGVAAITMTITNNTNKDLNIRLYSIGTLLYHKVLEFTIPANSSYYASMEDLDKEEYYFFRFSKGSDFSGYVTGYPY